MNSNWALWVDEDFKVVLCLSVFTFVDKFWQTPFNHGKDSNKDKYTLLCHIGLKSIFHFCYKIIIAVCEMPSFSLIVSANTSLVGNDNDFNDITSVAIN